MPLQDAGFFFPREKVKQLFAWATIYRGGGNFARGEFRGENFAVKKGGEIFPWRNFGVTVPSFTTAAGIVFPEQGRRDYERACAC